MIKKLFAHSGFKKYSFNTIWVLSEKLLRILSGLFVGVLVARHLGPENFGILSYVQSFVGLFLVFATLGLDSIVVKELLNHKENSSQVLGTSFVMKLVGATFIFPLLSIGILFTQNDEFLNYLIYILALSSIFKSFGVVDFYFQSIVQSKYTSWAISFALIISSIIKILLVIYNAELKNFVFANVFDSFIISIMLIFINQKYSTYKIQNWKFNLSLSKKLFVSSIPLIFSGLVITIYMKIDQVMIQNMLSSYDVGIYSVAVKLSEAVYFLPVVLANSLFPALLNVRNKDKYLYKKRLQRLYTFVTWLALTIVFLFYYFGEWIINLLFGIEYSDSLKPMLIHIIASIFVFWGVVHAKYLISENKQKELFYRTFLAMSLNIVLNYMLIPVYGITGAAIGILISQFFANFVYDLLFKETRSQAKMKLKTFILKI
jgi:O-antigen/teichoic acid export membrane protein